jgi:hypothetical protein
MKANTRLLIAGIVIGSMGLASCGGGSHTISSPVAAAPTTSMLDTVEVLNIVQTQTSETTQPFAVNGGVVAFTPVDDSTQPTVVDGT